jgi:hypothetical protein
LCFFGDFVERPALGVGTEPVVEINRSTFDRDRAKRLHRQRHLGQSD